MMKWKRGVKKRSWSTLRHYPGMCLEGLNKTMKTLSQDSRSLVRDLNPGPHIYELGVFPTGLRRLVSARFENIDETRRLFETISKLIERHSVYCRQQ
jgi:hypothetical protein